MAAQRARLDVGPAGDEVGDQASVGSAVGPGDHRRVAHLGMCSQRRLDLAQLDAVAVDLDLVVAPAEELDVAVGQVPAEVAGAVEPLAGARVRRRSAAAVRSGSPSSPAPRRAADVELAGHPGRTRRAAASSSTCMVWLASGVPYGIAVQAGSTSPIG